VSARFTVPLPPEGYDCKLSLPVCFWEWDKQIASLVAQKNVTAMKEARARRKGQADMSALWCRNTIRVRREHSAKLREKLAKRDMVFNYINRKSGEVGSIPAIRVGDTYVQGREALHLFAELYGKPEIGRTGFDLGFGLIVARTHSSYQKANYQCLSQEGTQNTPSNYSELIKLLTSQKANKAAGHDDLSPSVLKADPQGLFRVIGPLFRRIWEECVFPEEWGICDVSPIPLIFVCFLYLSNALPITWREDLFTRLFSMLSYCRSVRLPRPPTTR
jgi:hypothetical protein